MPPLHPHISLIIPCHNYGAALPRCLQSVLGQSVPPDEVIVIDDASDEDIHAIVAKFAQHGVRYHRVEYRDPLRTRREGFSISACEILCFIDADDFIGPLYLEKGLPLFQKDDRIAIVYSDVEFLGDKSGRSDYPPTAAESDISLQNFIHSGALVRRDAIEVTDAFGHGGPFNRHEDWSTWRKILSAGFRAIKQEELYYYFKHAGSLSEHRNFGLDGYTYYDGAALSEETITLFTPLLGRYHCWERYRHFLEEQYWNHRKVHLFLLDLSGDDVFSSRVRRWMADSDYPDIRYLRSSPAVAGLADGNRSCQSADDGNVPALKSQRLEFAKIYNHLRLARTDYLWIVEDDIIPPLDACDRLLRSFDSETMSVSGAIAYPRDDKRSHAWGEDGELLCAEDCGVQPVSGNGFGCAMLRGQPLRDWVFGYNSRQPEVERAFYKSLLSQGRCKVDWGLRCEYLPPEKRIPIKTEQVCDEAELPQDLLITEETFDEGFYLDRNLDVKRAVLLGLYASGYEHFNLYGRNEKRIARALPSATNPQSGLSDSRPTEQQDAATSGYSD
jgi:glycosyltransferase involved in cell wall biosynthesis